MDGNSEQLQVINLKQLPIIEERLRDVKAKIEQRTSAVMALAVTEETRTDVKKIRTEVRKEYCCPGYPGERYRRVRRALLGHLYRRQESPRDRPAELYLPDRWHRLPGRCPQGPGQVICPARSADPACSCVTDGSHIYDNTPCWSANYRQVRYARREALSGHFFEE